MHIKQSHNASSGAIDGFMNSWPVPPPSRRGGPRARIQVRKGGAHFELMIRQFEKILNLQSTPPVATTQRICLSWAAFAPPVPFVEEPSGAVLQLPTLSRNRSGVALPAAASPFSIFRTMLGAHRSEVMKRSCGSPMTLTHRASWLRSQHLTVLSSAADRRYLPPGWNTSARTQLSWPTRVMRQVPRASQRRIVLSLEPVAINSAELPAGGGFFSPAIGARYWYAAGGARAQHSMWCSCPNMVCLLSVLVAPEISHNRAIMSSTADRRERPSNEVNTSRTQPAWPLSVLTQNPVLTSHIFKVLSLLALTNKFAEAGINRTALTLRSWPDNVRM